MLILILNSVNIVELAVFLNVLPHSDTSSNHINRRRIFSYALKFVPILQVSLLFATSCSYMIL